MKDAIKRAVFLLLAVLMFSLTACGYAGIASHNGRLYVAKNGLFGILRQIYVCNEASGGKLDCKPAAKP